MTAESEIESVPTRTKTRQLAKILVLVALAGVVWLVSFNGSSDGTVAAVLEDAMPIDESTATGGVASTFSLDARFIEGTNVAPVYVLEQRAAPNHRVAYFDPASGVFETVWSIPDASLVHSIAMSPDESYLAMAVTVDFENPGNELVLLDLGDGETMSVWKGEPGDHITDLAWSLDGSVVWATHIAGSAQGAEAFTAVAIGVATGVVVDEIALAVSPAPLPNGVAVLDVDPIDAARRSLTMILDTEIRRVAVEDGTRELDHLVYDPTRDRLLVAALVEPEAAVVAFGTPAAAHGNHNVVSDWFAIDLRTGDSTPQPVEMTSTVVYDATVLDDGAIVFVTREGLSIVTADGQDPVTVMASRALRKVSG